MTGSYRNLDVWQKSIELVKEVYKITALFPKEEMFGLISQMRRSAVSIPSNIAEGKMRGYEKDLRKFLLIAFGSGAELETQIFIAKFLPKMGNLDFLKVDGLLNEVMKMLNQFVKKLEANC